MGPIGQILVIAAETKKESVWTPWWKLMGSNH